MRKLLLASAAVLGASVGTMGFASAQTTNLPPATLVPAPYGGATPFAPQPGAGANNNNNYQAPVLPPGPTANPVPGSVVVRLGGRVNFYAAVESSSLDVTKGTGPTNAGAAKLSPYQTLGYARLYAGVDGLATNGLRYGAAIEVRENFGPITGSTTNNQSSSSTFSDTLYVRRAFIYAGTASSGLLRLGQADGPWGIFDNGITTFQGFNDGAWNGDLPGAIPGNSQPQFPFLTQQGAEYGSSKVVYLSPQLAGFDFGLSWAPNNGSMTDGPGGTTGVNLANPTSTTLTGCGIAASGCGNLSSSSLLSDSYRFMNMYEAALRMQETFGPVGVLAYGGYMGSGTVSYQGPAVSSSILGSTYNGKFNGLSMGVGGAAITFGPITVGGNVQGGNSNGIGALQPQGGVHAIAWMGGIQYASGPLTVGTSYYQYDSQGTTTLVGISQRHETGFAAGGTYALAPGMVIYLSYLYGTRHQGDYDFQTGSVGTAAYNNVKGQAFSIGTQVKW
jgi:hypothetical protein